MILAHPPYSKTYTTHTHTQKHLYTHDITHISTHPLPPTSPPPNTQSTTSWRKAQARFEHTPEFQACEKVERLEVFAEHIKGLERAEREVKEQERHAQKRQARLNRDAFRQLLELHVQEGRITAKTTWKVWGVGLG